VPTTMPTDRFAPLGADQHGRMLGTMRQRSALPSDGTIASRASLRFGDADRK